LKTSRPFPSDYIPLLHDKHAQQVGGFVLVNQIPANKTYKHPTSNLIYMQPPNTSYYISIFLDLIQC
jgi:hypothetical protein